MAAPPPASSSSPATAAQIPLPWPEACTQMLKIHGYTEPVKLGEGGYSIVYQFKSAKTGDRKDVAIKYIDMDKVRDPAYKLKYMPRELRALMLLKHPNICQILEGLNDGPIHADKFPHRYWIIMELCKSDLFEIAALHPRYMIPEKFARIWIKQIASALEYMKDNTWAHRDIKSENILIRSAGSAALTDFSFVREQEPHTLSTTPIGTPLYSAPEVLRCMLKDLDAYDAFPADVWSLAATTFFATTGTGFAPNAAENPKDILPCLSEVQRNISVNSYISDYLKNLLTGMTDMIPAKRLTIEQVSKHEWFTVPENELVPKPIAATPPPGSDPSRTRSKKIVTPAHATSACQQAAGAAKTSAGHHTKTSATPVAPVEAQNKNSDSTEPAPPTDTKVSHKSGNKPQATGAAAAEVPHIPKSKSLPAVDNPTKAAKAATVPLIKLEKKKSPDESHKQNPEAKNEKTSKSQPTTPQAPTKSKSSESAKGAHGKDTGKDGKKTKSV